MVIELCSWSTLSTFPAGEGGVLRAKSPQRSCVPLTMQARVTPVSLSVTIANSAVAVSCVPLACHVTGSAGLTELWMRSVWPA